MAVIPQLIARILNNPKDSIREIMGREIPASELKAFIATIAGNLGRATNRNAAACLNVLNNMDVYQPEFYLFLEREGGQKASLADLTAHLPPNKQRELLTAFDRKLEEKQQTAEIVAIRQTIETLLKGL